MKGRWAFLVNGLLALTLVGFVAACGGDDDDDDGNGAGSGGAGMSGGGGSSGMSGGGGSSGMSGGGGSAGMTGMITAMQCVTNSKMESPMTPEACLTCVCGKNAKVINDVDTAGWKLIECIGAKCDGDGASACVSAADGCMAFLGGATTAVPTSMIFPMCKTECGIGDMSGADGGVDDAGL